MFGLEGIQAILSEEIFFQSRKKINHYIEYNAEIPTRTYIIMYLLIITIILNFNIT